MVISDSYQTINDILQHFDVKICLLLHILCNIINKVRSKYGTISYDKIVKKDDLIISRLSF